MDAAPDLQHVSGAVPRAVILAAGRGARIRGDLVPKPLVRLGGLALLERTVRTMARAGVREFVVVLGCHAEEIRTALTPRLSDLSVEWVLNEEWESGNGSSVLAARASVGKTFLIAMADHLIFPSTVQGLLARGLDGEGAVMAVDRKPEAVSDVADAAKVVFQGGRIVEIGKALATYDALDTGLSLCGPGIFTALERSTSTSDGVCEHGAGMRELARAGDLFWHDIGADRWEDVDTPEARAAAEKILFASLRKPTDGWASRFVERNISLWVTRRLARTSIRPNQITAAVSLIGITAGCLFSLPGAGVKIAAAVLFWFSSFLDGCDGELARLKFMESPLGGWLDLWSDNLVHVSVFLGMGVGLYRDGGNPIHLWLGAAAALGVLLSVGWVSLRIRASRRDATGPLFVSVTGSDGERAGTGLARRLQTLADALSRRDFIPFVILLAILGWIGPFLWAAAIGSNLYFLVLVAIHLARGRTVSGRTVSE